MGATGFEYVVRGTSMSAQQAYNQAVSDAVSEHGHDPYNGTISTTNGVIIASQDPMTLAQAHEFANKYYDGEVEVRGVEKWEAAGAVPLLKGTDEFETRSKKVTLDTVEYASFRKGNQDVVKAELRVLKGYALVDFKVTDVDATIKVETKATDGERETRYFIEGDGYGPARWDQGYPSQAEARAALDAYASDQDTQRSGFGDPVYATRNQKWGIYAITRRADGSSLVRTRRLIKRAVLTVEYRMEKNPGRKVRDGWYFFGWAAC